MKKLLILMLVFLPISLAVNNCEEYLINAQNYPEETYPWYFGVGQEYMSAAECYDAQGEQIAQQYYGDGTIYFISATTFLVEGGDYLLRGRAYEGAADAYLKIGNEVGAEQYYDKAMEQYEICDCKGEMAALTAKLNPPLLIDYMFFIGIGVVFAFFVIMLLFIRRRRGGYEESEWVKPSTSGSAETTTTVTRPAPSRPSAQTPSRPIPPPVLDAKEKMRRRIRERYKLD